jgi:TPR repeat protein
MNTTFIPIPALFALALKAARSAPRLEAAMAAYERGDYLEAESLLLVAGHSGDPHAQELLGFMYAIGPALFPGIWRTLMAAGNWFERAAGAGRPAAQYMHLAFTRHGLLKVRADIMASFDPPAPGFSDALPRLTVPNSRESAVPGEE